MNSIILKKRLKYLYSYSKQSLAPAVSTVGFFFFIKLKPLEWDHFKITEPNDMESGFDKICSYNEAMYEWLSLTTKAYF